MSERYCYRVDETPRLVQWSIDNFISSHPPYTPVFLDMGKWSWYLRLEKYKRTSGRAYVPLSGATTASLFVKYVPISGGDIGTHLIASFSVRVVSLSGGRKTLYYEEFKDKEMESSEEFVLGLGVPLTGRFIVQVEFLHLKTASPNVGESDSIWSEGSHKNLIYATEPSCLGKFFSESVHTDITICASDGTKIGAHRLILAARSTVFNSMFFHDRKEKNISSVDIPDMSVEALRVFLTYMYWNPKYEDFIVHRLDLLRAADKYDVWDLKYACEESLLEDIDTNNVLERLQSAFLYGLPRLKARCMLHLVRFGKFFEIREEFNEFIHSGGDRELVSEVLNEIISVWEDF